MDHWIHYNFKETGRPQTLILIGDSGTGDESRRIAHLPVTLSESLAFLPIGKTTFAKSLFGIVNYYRGHRCPVAWQDNADCMVFDDILWDDFDKKGFPGRRDLLTGQSGLFVSLNVSPPHNDS